MSERVERFEILINATPQEVWRCLTTSEGLSSWLGTESEIDLFVGATRRVAWGDLTSFNAEVKAIEPMRRLEVVYTDGEEGTGAEEWLVESKGKSTRLTLINTMSDDGIDNWEGFYGDIRRGWRLFMESMRFALEDANRPNRKAICVAVPAPGPRSEVWDRALKPLLDHETVARMDVRIEDPPHSLFFGSSDRSLLLDIEGSGEGQVVFFQAADHGGGLAWSEDVLEVLKG